MSKKPHKTNHIKGQRKAHSVVREIMPFLEGLLTLPFTVSLGSGRMVAYNFHPTEPVEVREFSIEGNTYMKLRTYAPNFFQDIYVFCHIHRFPEVMEYINNYCERAS